MATIAWAIGVDHGWMSLKQRTIYAEALKKTAAKYDFDPFTGVALIDHESKWRASAVGDDGAAIGLAQIHYRNLCKSEKSCERKRAELLNGAANIMAMGAIIDQKRRWCRKQTGKPALFARWLHAYGYRQKRNLKCNMRKVKGRWKDLPVPTEAARIIKYRRRLINLLSRKRKSSKRRG